MESYRRRLPVWVWGALIGLLLIGLSTRGRFDGRNDALSRQFALQPTPEGISIPIELPQLDFSNLSPSLQAASEEIRSALRIGRNGRPLEPRAQSARLLVEINAIAPSDGGLVVRGSVTNISAAPLTVPISAFELRDSNGGSYVAGGGASADLQPGENTPLELTVPLSEGLGLMLVTNLPPDPPLEQRLLGSEE